MMKKGLTEKQARSYSNQLKATLSTQIATLATIVVSKSPRRKEPSSNMINKRKLALPILLQDKAR